MPSNIYIPEFGLLRVRSPLLTKYTWYLFLQVLRCFTSLGLLPTLLRDHRDFALWSFLIRTSPDRRLLGTSPTHIAATPRPSSPLTRLGIHHTPLTFPLSCEGESNRLRTAIICCFYNATYFYVADFVTFHLHEVEKTLDGKLLRAVGFGYQSSLYRYFSIKKAASLKRR